MNWSVTGDLRIRNQTAQAFVNSVGMWNGTGTPFGVKQAGSFVFGNAPQVGGTLKPVPAYNSCGLGLMPPAALADEAEQLLAGGFRAVKLRLGYPTLHEDMAALHAVRRRVPAAINIMADFNQALSADEALLRGRALDGEGVYWIEEPIRHDDYRGCAMLAREL